MSAVPSSLTPPAELGDRKFTEKSGVPSGRKRRGLAKNDHELPDIVRRFAAGEITVHDILKQRGGTLRGVYKWMLSGLGEDKYSEIITSALIARIADADEGLEGAETQVEVSKYSQIGKFARMDFERKRPALYGAKPVQVNFSATVVDKELADSMQALLDRVVPVALEKVVEEDADAS